MRRTAADAATLTIASNLSLNSTTKYEYNMVRLVGGAGAGTVEWGAVGNLCICQMQSAISMQISGVISFCYCHFRGR